MPSRAEIVGGLVADLAAELPSHSVFASIDKVVSELLALRKIAVSIHGDVSPIAISVATESKNPDAAAFDGTVKGLIASYKTHSDSPIHQLSYASRESYKYFLQIIEDTLGSETVANLSEERVRRAYDEWSSGDRLAMGFSVAKALGRLATFGDTVLKDRSSRELRITLRDLKFPRPKARQERFTREMADKIRAAAHRKGLPSIALAQALQFDLGLSQRDVLGEWVPMHEDGISVIHFEKKKWIRGAVWSEIKDWVLYHDGKELDLRHAKMVMEELAPYKGSLPSTADPIVVSERTGRPWSSNEFRKAWRKIADECGIPKNVRNQDSRGAVDENDKTDQAFNA
jgi:hypothetical protein